MLKCSSNRRVPAPPGGYRQVRHAKRRAAFKREDAILNSGYHLFEMPWQLESIRATVFAPDIKALGLPDWQKLTGTGPAHTQPNREVDGVVEAGPYKAHWLTIGLARRPARGLGRADLILAPPQPTVVVPLPPPGEERIESAAIGPFTTNFPHFWNLPRTGFLSTPMSKDWLSLAHCGSAHLDRTKR
jgi:hypothetical protein